GMGGGGFGGRRQYFNTQGLEVPAQMLESGQYANAISELERIRTQRPYDPNVLGMLGQAYYKSGQPDKAGFFFRSAMRVGRSGGEQSRAMNAYLLDMSREAQATQPVTAAPRAGVSVASMILPFLGFGGRNYLPTSGSQTTASGGTPSYAKGK